MLKGKLKYFQHFHIYFKIATCFAITVDKATVIAKYYFSIKCESIKNMYFFLQNFIITILLFLMFV